MDRVVIVGASAAGLTAATTLRRVGFTGEVTLVGAETDLPYDRPPLSKRVLSREWEPAVTALRSAEEVRALDLDLRLGTRAEALDLEDRRVLLSDGSAAAYDGLIVATGATPRRPFGEDLDGLHHLRTVDDAVRLRDRLGPGRRLVIIGAGLIGMEVAAVARARGAQVRVIEPNPTPLVGAVGVITGDFLADLHRSNGVVLRTGVSAVELECTQGRVTGVVLDDTSTIPADDVLIATGTEPNTAWLADSGLAIDDGIVCDEYCAAAPNEHCAAAPNEHCAAAPNEHCAAAPNEHCAATEIYAAGDVAQWHNPLFGVSMRVEHRTNAGEQAMAAARNLLARPEERVPFAPVPYFWTDQYDAKVQVHGHLAGHDEERLIDGDPTTGRFLVAFRRGQHVAAVVSVGVPPRALRPWREAIASRASWQTTTGSSTS